MPNAIATIGATLKWCRHTTPAGTPAKVVDIKSYPDLIGEPQQIDVTTLTDSQVQNINGVKQSNVLTFPVNYTSANYADCVTDENHDLDFELVFSDNSKFSFNGQYTLGVPGKGVNDAVEFNIYVALSSVPSFTATPVVNNGGGGGGDA